MNWVRGYFRCIKFFRGVCTLFQNWLFKRPSNRPYGKPKQKTVSNNIIHTWPMSWGGGLTPVYQEILSPGQYFPIHSLILSLGQYFPIYLLILSLGQYFPIHSLILSLDQYFPIYLLKLPPGQYFPIHSLILSPGQYFPILRNASLQYNEYWQC